MPVIPNVLGMTEPDSTAELNSAGFENVQNSGSGRASSLTTSNNKTVGEEESTDATISVTFKPS